MRRVIGIALLLVLLSSFSGFVGAANQGTDAPTIIAQDAPVTPIGVNFGVVGGYRYMRVAGKNSPVYDAPRTTANVLYRFADGYDFVTPRTEQGNWIEINPGEWMRKQNLVEVYPSYFTGVVINGEPAVPFGWVLINHYASNAPGGAEVVDPAFRLTRYNVVSLYNVTVVDGWRWYDVGGGRWVKQTNIGKVQRIANPGISGRWVAIDLYEQTLTAYDGNTMVFATLIASGLPGTDTNPGVFNIWAWETNAPMSGQQGGYGNYRLENVPYAMFFDGDISLHGTYWHNRFGFRQSRGCVNLTISDARWLFEWFGGSGSVYVYYSQSY